MNPIPFTYTAWSKLEQSLIEREIIIKFGSVRGISLTNSAAD
jgi:hypothetical protein